MTTSFGITTTQSVILNLIRFLCSQGVLLGHMLRFFQKGDTILGGIASYFVMIFFILSGFLISHSLKENIAKHKDYQFRLFLTDRFFRIYPPFVAALVFVFILDAIVFSYTGQDYSLSMYCSNFLINVLQLQEFPLATFLNEHYMIEFFRFHYFGSDLPLWTIGIEWWLYIFYGYLVFYILKNQRVKMYHFLLLGFLSLTPLYYLFVGARMEKGLTIYWFLGVLITFAAVNQRKKEAAKLTFGFTLFLITSGMFGYQVLGYHTSILLFFLGLFLLYSFQREEVQHFNHFFKNIAERLAGYSYSLYLIHFSLLYFITSIFHFDFNSLNFILIFFIINIIAFCFALCFEKTSRTLKLKYENYRSRNNRLQEKI